jgi:hypothetical protein
MAGSIIGLIALIAAALPQLVLPAVLPGTSAGPIAIETGHSLKERITTKLKSMIDKKQETRSQQSELDIWKQRFSTAAISLALLAIGLAVFATFRREDRFFAGLAAALGTGAIAFQLTILLAGAAVILIVLYAVRDQLDGAILATPSCTGFLTDTRRSRASGEARLPAGHASCGALSWALKRHSPIISFSTLQGDYVRRDIGGRRSP